MKTLLYIILLLLVMITTAAAGDRRTIAVYKDGTHVMVPDVGECNPAGCVLEERTLKQWNGVVWIYQRIDVDGDGVCDIQIAWKPLEDPKYGVYYTVDSNKLCER
jgi:hypothetical protein